MKAVVQRVRSARVEADDEIVGEIGPGLLILLGVTHRDSRREAQWLADKCLDLRIFEGRGGKMNRSVRDLGGEVMVVSQFTLYGDTRKGRRPSFVEAAAAEHSRPLYNYFVSSLREASGLSVAEGIFGAKMRVHLVNDGPVTLIVEKNPDEAAQE